MKYIASCSFGKDSLATILLAKIHNEPLDEVIFSEVMFDHSRGISGENPAHIDWVYRVAIPKLEAMGVKVRVLRDSSDYLQQFYKRVTKSRTPERNGKYRGFPMGGKCVINSAIKVKPIKDYLKSIPEPITQYIGIAIDEQSRLERMHVHKDKVSLLEKYNYTEQMAKELCQQYGLLSPLYSSSHRGGCWFCPNGSVKSFAKLRKDFPHLWAELEVLSNEKDVVRKGFKWAMSVSDLKDRMDAYDAINESNLF